MKDLQSWRFLLLWIWLMTLTLRHMRIDLLVNPWIRHCFSLVFGIALVAGAVLLLEMSFITALRWWH